MSIRPSEPADRLSAHITEVVMRYFAAADAGDRAALEEVLADEASFTLWGQLPMSGVTVGKRAIIEGMMPAARALFQPGTLRLYPTHLVAEADHVVAEVRAEGTTTAGAAYEGQYCMVFEVRHGLIRAVREYMDTSYAERVLCTGD